jgi:hypothetical protein
LMYYVAAMHYHHTDLRVREGWREAYPRSIGETWPACHFCVMKRPPVFWYKHITEFPMYTVYTHCQGLPFLATLNTACVGKFFYPISSSDSKIKNKTNRKEKERKKKKKKKKGGKRAKEVEKKKTRQNIVSKLSL